VLELLGAALGERCSVAAEEPLGHQWAAVTRLTLDREIPGVGRTVVVKTRRVEGDGWGGPAHLRRELAGLRTAEPSGVTPRLIAADDRAGVVVTTDLGRWPTLASLLGGDDAAAAGQAVVALGRAAGRLHAATVGARSCHAQALTALGGYDARIDRFGHWPGADRWCAVEAASAELGFPDARIAREDIALIVERLLDPGPFAALAHMDLNPTNVLVTAAGAKLVDFEGSIFGHIGVDASFLHFPFPNDSAHWAVLPAELVAEADRAYRAALAPALSAGASAGYDEMLAIGAGAAIAVRVQRLAKLAQHDQPLHDRWRRRAQLHQQIEVFTRLAARTGSLPALAAWFSQLADAMADRWPDATAPPAPPFPAFRAAR
jgi:hypothetical protein